MTTTGTYRKLLRRTRRARVRTHWLPALALGALIGLGDPAGAETGTIGGSGTVAGTGSAEFSFEQLSAMEVSGVSKSVERVLDAPAAVTVVTSDDIRTYGYQTLAEILDTVPGFFTYTDRGYTYVGVQGFAPIGSYNSRILLLIDGFPANDDFFQQALIGSEGIVDVDLIDRVEVIRGPGSSLYGTNALLGVVNVVLKTPSQTLSGAQAWVGSGDERGVSGTLSARAGDATSYFLRVTGATARGLDVVFAPQPGIPDGTRVQGEDGYDITRAFAKIQSGNLRVNVAFSERRQQAGFGLYGDALGYPNSFVRDGETFVDARYEGTLGDATDYALRASLAEYRYFSEIGDPDPPSAAALPGYLPVVGDWVDTEATVTHRFNNQNRLVFGTELRRDYRVDATFSNPLQGQTLAISNAENRFGFYAQNDVDWSDQWSTSLGLRDDIDNHVDHVNPRLALLWKPTGLQAVKVMYGSAFREASTFERLFAQPPFVLANPLLAPERIRTLDIEYENHLSKDSSLTATVFRYRATDLITNEVVDPATNATQYQNAGAEQARGVDLTLEQRLPADVTAHLNASYVFAYDAAGNWEPNAPKWTGRLGVDQKLGDTWRLGGEELFAGKRLAIDDESLPGYALANLTLSSKPHPGRFDFSFSLYNAFNHLYAAPVAGWQGDRVDQLGRTWRARAGYSF